MFASNVQTDNVHVDILMSYSPIIPGADSKQHWIPPKILYLNTYEIDLVLSL